MTSFIWNHFSVLDQDDEVAECLLCKKGIRRGPEGSKAKNFSTSPLHRHLQAKHPLTYQQAKEQSETAKRLTKTPDQGPSLKQRKLTLMGHQSTLKECMEMKKIWDINDSRAVTIHQKIMKMIATDNQPFTIVEDMGFVELMGHIQPNYLLPSRRYFSEVMLPKTYDELKTKLKEELLATNAPFMSFTSDIWTCQHSNESFVSLTAHWIDPEFQRKNAVLHAKHFPGSHTGENIEQMIRTMMADWGITEERQHILVRDGAANMALGTRLANMSSVHCFLHILDLIVRESIFDQRAVIDMRAKVKRISTHFSHSSLGCNELKNLQREQGIKQPLITVQDVPTRWNSTYMMLERALTLKRPILLYTANHDLPILSSNEWNLLEKLLHILQPFYEITKQVSSEVSTLSEVIPHVIALDRYLSRQGNDIGVQTTKKSLQKALKKRLLSSVGTLNILEEKNYMLATALDPRYKLKYMKEKRETVRRLLIESMTMRTQQNITVEESSETTDSEHEDITPPAEPMVEQVLLLQETIHNDFMACYDDHDDTQMGVTNTTKASTIDTRLATLVSEIDKYFDSPVIQRSYDPVEFWKDNKNTFPEMSQLSRRYLSCPASSVYSERLFSEAGNIFDEHRARLLPKTGEKLLFLHHNMRKSALK